MPVPLLPQLCRYTLEVSQKWYMLELSLYEGVGGVLRITPKTTPRAGHGAIMPTHCIIGGRSTDAGLCPHGWWDPLPRPEHIVLR